MALGTFVRGVEAEPGRTIDQFTVMVGEEPSTVLLYQNWENDSAFDPAVLDAVADRGATPILTWAPRDPDRGKNHRKYSLQKIINGRYDAYIRGWARDAAAWDKPLYLRFAHEMNSSFYSWGVGVNGNTAADYVAAWRHIHDIFAQEGADEVRWVWSPLADNPTSRDELEQMYPGDDYVDWLALDGYNWGTEGLVLAEWRTVGEIFGASYDKLITISDKPVMIAEVASAEAGGSKANWIKDGFLEDVPSRLPNVRAVVWFSSNKLMDWRVNSSPESLDAYGEVAGSCLYQGRLP
ncbi:MAG: glycosyl hydrolase [Rubrobacteraceae bacterium]